MAIGMAGSAQAGAPGMAGSANGIGPPGMAGSAKRIGAAAAAEEDELIKGNIFLERGVFAFLHSRKTKALNPLNTKPPGW